jgi:hypothetical protein
MDNYDKYSEPDHVRNLAARTSPYKRKHQGQTMV